MAGLGRPRRVGGSAFQPRGRGESGIEQACGEEDESGAPGKTQTVGERRIETQGAAELPKKERLVIGLDIGSTKTCALVGEMDEEGSVKFLALGAAESKGWRKGQIVNLDLAVSSIRRAVEEAETVVGVPVESALIGI